MRKTSIPLLIVLLLPLCLTACEKQQAANPFWGSFTPDKTYSFDHRYYALQTVADQMIIVTVYDAGSGERIDDFSPARAADFWGICWEKDTYNLWTQSADIGDSCYSYQDGKWVRNDQAIEPDYIVSRYDKACRDHPELWQSIYMSPTE